ncbi:unnamed protein product [Didymodactylos carnosus]|uniref:HAT C-terminal dimerisation domain-containing protein n=1 Tax=Didymodactylos carnosus TaxID=1234261 RepID=A0A814NUD4_9BILA|nr:unnamed protein product [Didymodactylos carnosus]CAF1115250.1 unnamed protein product [Didymodactylos carnosus]CAF3861878.1 unnamed protein product [Didymodactylos carnosus]CAF3885282.1 unnamed protein product [Didymodactylos carnosus]
MPGNESAFRHEWLERTDSSGFKCKLWLKPGASSTTYTSTAAFSKTQPKLIISNDNKTRTINTEPKFTFDDLVTISEIKWAMNVAQKGYSYRSVDDSSAIFKSMFPDSSIADKFSMGRHKLSYTIQYGLEPYFHDMMVDDLKRSNSFFSILIDETTTVQVKKQFDIMIRYWSELKKRVVIIYFHSEFFGHATAEHLKTALINSLEANGVDLNKLLTLSMDGQNVNLLLFKLMNAYLTNKGIKQMIFIGKCNIRIAHNSFRHGQQAVTWDIDDIVIDLHQWFKHSSARREDYKKMANEINETAKMMPRFIDSRWLQLCNVLDRIIQQWEMLKNNFLSYLPEHGKTSIRNNKRYDRIKKTFSDEIICVRILFIRNFDSDFNRFCTIFQEQAPLIRVLYDELCELLKNLLLRYLKQDAIDKIHDENLVKIDYNKTENRLSESKYDIGVDVRRALNEIQNPTVKTNFLKDVRVIFESCTQYLVTHLPLKNAVLRDMQCVHPLMKTKPATLECISRLAYQLPIIVSNMDIDVVRMEWKQYQMEEIPKNWYIEKEWTDTDGNYHTKYQRIDFYWLQISEIHTTLGAPKYPLLTKLLKNLLAFSHGSADVERGFSLNNYLLDDFRSSLNEKSIISLRSINSGILFEGGQPEAIKITKSMLTTVRQSYSKMQFEQKKQQKPATDTNTNNQLNETHLAIKKVNKEESSLLKQQIELQKRLFDARTVLSEGHTRLTTAIKQNKMVDITVAHSIIETSQKQITDVSNELELVTKSLKKGLKRKESLLKDAADKKLKKHL